MRFTSLIIELIRARPRLVVWLAVSLQAALWLTVSLLLYRSPPDDLATVLADPRRFAANTEAVQRVQAVRAMLVDVVPAGEALPLGARDVLHAGPPIDWAHASGPMRGALVGACLFEGWADTAEDAERLLTGGGVTLQPCHHHRTVGPMAGVTSPSMWMWCLADPVNGGRAFFASADRLGDYVLLDYVDRKRKASR